MYRGFENMVVNPIKTKFKNRTDDCLDYSPETLSRISEVKKAHGKMITPNEIKKFGLPARTYDQ